VLFAWAALAQATPWIVAAFDAKGESAGYVVFYCRYGVVAWLFLACLFVANTALKNLGFPMLSMVFNWGRATLSTIPFVTLGVRYDGVKGGLVGIALGCAVFGVIAVATVYATTARLEKRAAGGQHGGRRDQAMTLNDILHAAQGGQAVGNLARRYGLTPEAAEAATQAMLPAFSVALEHLKQHPGAFGGLIAQMAKASHGASFAGNEAEDDAAHGQAAAGVFGSPDAIREVVEHVAKASQVAPATVEAVLPRVASILVGGLAQAMTSQGHGGALGDLAAAASAPGGIDSALASAGTSGGGLMGMLHSFFGGSNEPVNPQTAAVVAGLTALTGMFVAGVAASQASQASLNALAGSFTQPPTTL